MKVDDCTDYAEFFTLLTITINEVEADIEPLTDMVRLLEPTTHEDMLNTFTVHADVGSIVNVLGNII